MLTLRQYFINSHMVYLKAKKVSFFLIPEPSTEAVTMTCLLSEFLYVCVYNKYINTVAILYIKGGIL